MTSLKGESVKKGFVIVKEFGLIGPSNICYSPVYEDKTVAWNDASRFADLQLTAAIDSAKRKDLHHDQEEFYREDESPEKIRIYFSAEGVEEGRRNRFECYIKFEIVFAFEEEGVVYVQRETSSRWNEVEE